MRLSVFIALLIAYVVGCMAVAFVAVWAIEHIVGDLGPTSAPSSLRSLFSGW